MHFIPAFGAVALLASLGSALAQKPPAPPERFLARIRVLGVEEARGEATILDPKGKTRIWKKGDRVAEEGALVKDIARSSLVLTRAVTGSQGETGESLIVVRFDATGRVKVREYSTVSDAPVPVAPRQQPLD